MSEFSNIFNERLLEHDLFMFHDEITEIAKITWEYPVDWVHIKNAIIEAKPLFEYLGPDGLFIAVHNEIIRRGLNDR